MTVEVPTGSSHGCTVLADISLVCAGASHADTTAIAPPTLASHAEATAHAKHITPSTQKPKTSGTTYLREALETNDLPQQSRELILARWRKSTSGQYNCYLEQWHDFAEREGHSATAPNQHEVIVFLTELVTRGRG